MNNLQIFNNPEFGEIRTIQRDGEAWFVGKDVATALGYKDTTNALKSKVDNEDKGGWQITTPSGIQEMTIINESGLYCLIFSSKLEKAREFKRWVPSVVLPSIRKQGAYIAPGAAPPGIEAAALQAVLQPIAAAVETLTAAVQALNQRMDGEGRGEMKALPPPPERNPFDDNPFADPPKPSSLLARKLWMKLVNEKLDLLSQRYGKPNNAILHRIYQDMEEHFETAMDEERCRMMEEQGLSKCSVLLAIFFDPELRDYFQRYVDYNLALENRGW